LLEPLAIAPDGTQKVHHVHTCTVCPVGLHWFDRPDVTAAQRGQSGKGCFDSPTWWLPRERINEEAHIRRPMDPNAFAVTLRLEAEMP
jgi:hypothetical protein